MGLTQAAQPIISYNYGARQCRTACAGPSGCCCAAPVIYAGGAVGYHHAASQQTYIGMFTPDAGAASPMPFPRLRIYMAASLLFGIQLSLPADLCGYRQRQAQPVPGGAAQADPAHPADLPPAAALLPDKATAVFLAEPVADTHGGGGYGAALPGEVYRAAMREMEGRAGVLHA